MNEYETICNCTIKKNAVLIAKILDCDINGWAFGEPFYSLVNEQRERFQTEYESYIEQFREEEDADKRFRLQMAMGVLKKTITAFDDVLHNMEVLVQDDVVDDRFCRAEVRGNEG